VRIRLDVSSEIATYRRVRAAIAAAREKNTVTELVGSTELSLATAAAYAQDHVLLDSLSGVRIVQRVGRLEIGPERRLGPQRRSGRDRRDEARNSELWAERRVNPNRRQLAERREPPRQVWEVAPSPL
jgi:hypothetical protein